MRSTEMCQINLLGQEGRSLGAVAPCSFMATCQHTSAKFHVNWRTFVDLVTKLFKITHKPMYDKTKTAKSTITKLDTGLVLIYQWIWSQKTKVQGHRIKNAKGDRVAGVSYALECLSAHPVVQITCFRSTPKSRPNKVGLRCPSVRTYVRTSVRPQNVDARWYAVWPDPRLRSRSRSRSRDL